LSKIFSSLLVLSFFSSPALAEVFRFPNVKVDGISHLVVVGGYLEFESYRWAPESADGFCHLVGRKPYSGIIGVYANAGPYVLLDSDGSIQKIFADLPENRGRFQVAELLDCD
jgi:hypothetical protein